MLDAERIAASNTVFSSGGVTCKLGALCFRSSSVQVDSFVLRNPPERKAQAVSNKPQKSSPKKIVVKLPFILAL